MPGVFDLMPAPDWAATTTIATENAAAHTPEEWARAIFDPRTVPSWVGALFAVRQTAVKALGIPRGGRWMLAVSRATSDEAIIDTDDRHLRFVAAVTAEPHLVHVTTAVTLKGWPLRKLMRLLICQPPTTRDSGPPLLSHLRPLPNGNSVMLVICRL